MIECPEFRQLLVYMREDLQDEDIPKRTKLRTAIMEAWYTYFPILKQELEVKTTLYSCATYRYN